MGWTNSSKGRGRYPTTQRGAKRVRVPGMGRAVTAGNGMYFPENTGRARGGGQTARRVAGGGKSNKKTAPAKGASKKRTR